MQPTAAAAVGTPEPPQHTARIASLRLHESIPMDEHGDAHERSMARAQQAQVGAVVCTTAILVAAVLGGFVMVYFQSVLIPFTIAVFMSYLIEPLVRLIMRAVGSLTTTCCGHCAHSKKHMSNAPPPSPDAEAIDCRPAGSLTNIQSIASPSCGNGAGPRAEGSASSDLESPDDRLAAPLLTRRSSDISSQNSGVLPPTTSTVTAARSGLPSGFVRAIAVLLSITIVASVLVFVGILVTNEIESLVSHLDAYKMEARNLEVQANGLLSTFGLNITQAEGYVQSAVMNMSFLGDAAGDVANFLVGVVITFFLTIFFLFSSELGHSPQLPPPPMSDSFGSVIAKPGEAPEHFLPRPLQSPLKQQISAQISRYLQLKACVCLGLGVAMAIFLAIIGVASPVFFGVVTFLVNFIPNFGCIVAYIAPLPVVFLDPAIGPAARLWACIVPISIHMFTGQVIEPRLYGANLDLHPATILLALLSWGVLWGVPGVIVAVPITATIKIWMSHRTDDPLGEHPCVSESKSGFREQIRSRHTD